MNEWLVIYRLAGEPFTEEMTISAVNKFMVYDIFEDYAKENEWTVVEFYCTMI